MASLAHSTFCVLLLAQGVWQRFHERFETVVVSRQLDRFINLRVDAHRLLAIRPTVSVEGLVLDVLVCITSCSVTPLVLALSPPPCARVSLLFSVAVVSVITDCENSMPKFSCRTRTLHVTARIQLEENSVCFDNA